jgi:hypothetical protein
MTMDHGVIQKRSAKNDLLDICKMYGWGGIPLLGYWV